MIYSYEVEKQVLAAFLQKPKVFVNYLNILSEKDFYDKNSLLHKTLFIILDLYL
jgi:replicative DNA helicase